MSTGDTTSDRGFLLAIGNTLNRIVSAKSIQKIENCSDLSGEICSAALRDLEDYWGVRVAGGLEGSYNG